VKRNLILPVLAFAAISGNAWALPADKETSHVVREGETLNGIANRAKVDRELIIKANGLEAPYTVHIGERLRIPRGEEAQKLLETPKPPPAPEPAAGTEQEPATARQPVSDQTETYVVQEGETLGGIANRTGVPRVLIAEANGLEPPFTIQAGQKLIIPRTRHHTVQEEDTGFGIALQYAIPWDDIAVANGIDPEAPIQVGRKLLIPTVLKAPEAPPPEPARAKPAPPAAEKSAPSKTPPPAQEPKKTAASQFIWPTNGEVRRGFKSRSKLGYHDGLDIAAPQGATVRAAAAGTVVYSGQEPQQFGNLVIIDHGDGWHSAYGSLDRITVKKGYKIAQGERLGTVGNTSSTGRVELHFELRKDNAVIDPLSALPKAP